jgi:hypothetical protein
VSSGASRLVPRTDRLVQLPSGLRVWGRWTLVGGKFVVSRAGEAYHFRFTETQLCLLRELLSNLRS